MPHAKKPRAVPASVSKGTRQNVPRLTEKMLRFIDAYMANPIAGKAALAAGYGKARADVQGCLLLQHPLIAAEIARRQADLREASGITALMIVRELAAIGFAKMGDYATWGGDKGFALRDSETVDTRGVAEVSESVTASGISRRIKLDKRAALNDLAAMLGYGPKKGGVDDGQSSKPDAGGPAGDPDDDARAILESLDEAPAPE